MIRSARNQLLVRGAEKAGAVVVASGLSRIKKGQTQFFTKKKKPQLHRKTSKGQRVKHGTDYTLIRSKTEGGRNFTSTRSQQKIVKSGARRVVAGRALPVMAYGFIAYDVMKGDYQAPGPNWYGISESDVIYLMDNPHVIRNEVKSQQSMFEQNLTNISRVVQVGIILGGAIFG